MRLLINTLIVLLVYCHSYGQLSDIVFIGVGRSNSGNSFSYKLQVSDSAGKISGYSVADITGPDETKSRVKGAINYDKKILTLRETKVVYTKYKFKNADSSQFCYIHAKLSIVKKKKTTMLKGDYIAYKDDQATQCDAGELVLLSAADVLNKVLKKEPKKDSIIKAVLKTQQTEEKKSTYIYEKAPSAPESQIIKVSPGSKIELLYDAATAKFELWDAKTIDGDIITIKHNRKIVLDNYKLSATLKELNLALNEEATDTIKIVAINEGTEPLNTTRIKITAGTKVYYVDASTTMNKEVMIILKPRE